MNEFRGYIAPILRWWWLVILSCIISGVASYFVAIRLPKVFEASAILVVGSAGSNANPSPIDFGVGSSLAQYYQRLAQSTLVQNRVKSALGGVATLPEYAISTADNLLTISVTDTSPELAQAVALALANEVIAQSPSAANPASDERRAFIESQLSQLQTDIQATDAEIVRLRQELATLESAVEIENVNVEIAAQQQKKTGLQANYTELLNSLGDSNVNQVRLLQPPSIPEVPVGPNVRLIVLAAALGGALLAVGAAYLIEFLDDTLRGSDDIPSLTGGLAVIGHIVDLEKGKDGALLTVADKPRSPAAEAFRSLRTNLEFAGVERPLRAVLVTSAAEEDGKSTVALNLALSLAQSGKRVALVDADLRKPTLHEALGIRNVEGLTDLFRKSVHVSDVLRTWKNDRVLVMTSGELPPNPTELLSSRRMDQILAALREMVDIVVVDATPFFIADAWVLAAKVDGIVWVSRPGHTRKGALRTLLTQAKRTGTTVLGIVLNRLSKSNSSYATRYSYLSHYYGEAPKQLEAPIVPEPGDLNGLQPLLRGKQRDEGALAEPAANVNGNVNGNGNGTANAVGHRVEVLPALPPEPPTTERGKVSLDLLYALSYELASQMDLNELMQRILKMTLESVGAASGSMIAIDQRGEPIEGVMIYDGRTYNQNADQLKDVVTRGLAGWVIENRRPVVLNNTSEDPRWLNRSWDENEREPRSAISVPLMADDRVVGVLTLVHPRANHFTRDDLSLLTAIAVGISFNGGAYANR